MFTPEEYASVESFYADAVPTPLVALDESLLVKDESGREGLNAFKILGVRYAVARLSREGRMPQGAVLACATDGNHGRAVARTAAAMGLASHVYLPSHASEARVRAIAGEGASVHIADGNYDDAVRLAAEDALKNGWLIVSDTSWPGYEEIPRWIMCGYTRLIDEASRQWRQAPQAVYVQAGVGGLACAVGAWFAQRFAGRRPRLICCQPERSPCIVEAARKGRPVRLEGSLETVMDCLSAGEVSIVAWPVIAALYDGYVTVSEEEAVSAVSWLADRGVASGYSGACGVAAWLRDRAPGAMAIVTEGRQPLQPGL